MSILGLLCSTQFVSFSFFLLFWLLSLICLKNELCIHIENWVHKSDWEPGGHDWSLSDMSLVQWSDGPLCLTTFQLPLPLSGELGSGYQFSRRHKGNERLLLTQCAYFHWSPGSEWKHWFSALLRVSLLFSLWFLLMEKGVSNYLLKTESGKFIEWFPHLSSLFSLFTSPLLLEVPAPPPMAPKLGLLGMWETKHAGSWLLCCLLRIHIPQVCHAISHTLDCFPGSQTLRLPLFPYPVDFYSKIYC